jgi:hypothetical protein
MAKVNNGNLRSWTVTVPNMGDPMAPFLYLEASPASSPSRWASRAPVPAAEGDQPLSRFDVCDQVVMSNDDLWMTHSEIIEERQRPVAVRATGLSVDFDLTARLCRFSSWARRRNLQRNQ